MNFLTGLFGILFYPVEFVSYIFQIQAFCQICILQILPLHLILFLYILLTRSFTEQNYFTLRSLYDFFHFTDSAFGIKSKNAIISFQLLYLFPFQTMRIRLRVTFIVSDVQLLWDSIEKAVFLPVFTFFFIYIHCGKIYKT